jgi:hypothetical protein
MMHVLLCGRLQVCWAVPWQSVNPCLAARAASFQSFDDNGPFAVERLVPSSVGDSIAMMTRRAAAHFNPLVDGAWQAASSLMDRKNK